MRSQFRPTTSKVGPLRLWPGGGGVEFRNALHSLAPHSLLLALALFIPWFEGGRHPVAWIFILALSLHLLSRLLAQENILVTGREWLWGTFLALGFVSTLLSVNPGESLFLFVRLCIYFLWFWAALQIPRDKWAESFLAILFGISILLAGLTLFQFSQGKMLLGLFPNPNLNVGFLAAAAAGGTAYALTQGKSAPRLLFILALLAIFMGWACVGVSRSRGALITLMSGSLIAFGLRFGIVRALLFCIPMALLFGMMPQEALETLLKFGDPFALKRPEIWKAALQMGLSHPFAGLGLGNFEFGFYEHNFPVWEAWVHYGRSTRFAHNEYLQVFSEMGMAAFLIFIAALFLWVKDVYRKASLADPAVSVSVVVASAVLVHALFDFNLHIPSTAFFLCLTAGISLRASLSEEREMGNPLHRWRAGGKRERIRIWRWPLITGGLLGICISAADLGIIKSRPKIARILNPLSAQTQASLAQDIAKDEPGRIPMNIVRQVDAYYKRAIRLSRRDPYLHLSAGHLWRSNAARPKSELALLHYKKALALHPKNPFAWVDLSSLYLEAKEPKKAKEALWRALAVEPEYQLPRLLLAHFALDEKNYSSAERQLQSLEVSLLKDLKPSTDYEKRLLEIQPAQILNARGRLEEARGHLEKALQTYRKAVRLSPKSAEIRSNLAALYARRKEYPKALEEARLAQNLEPLNPRHLHNLVLLYERMGEKKKARDLREEISRWKRRR